MRSCWIEVHHLDSIRDITWEMHGNTVHIDTCTMKPTLTSLHVYASTHSVWGDVRTHMPKHLGTHIDRHCLTCTWNKPSISTLKYSSVTQFDYSVLVPLLNSTLHVCSLMFTVKQLAVELSLSPLCESLLPPLVSELWLEESVSSITQWLLIIVHFQEPPVIASNSLNTIAPHHCNDNLHSISVLLISVSLLYNFSLHYPAYHFPPCQMNST